MLAPVPAPAVGPPPCLAAALEYLSYGWSPIALCPHDHKGVWSGHAKICPNPTKWGKIPLWKWEDYQVRRPRVGEIKYWWNRNPHSNVGIALGPVSGLVGLDIDGDGGEALLESWVIQAGEPLHTLEFTTPNGRRLLFQWDETLKNELYKIGGDELRLLAKGRYTVMPPSIHHTGQPYQWDADNCPANGAQAAPMPQWLLNLIRSQTQDGQGWLPAGRPPVREFDLSVATRARALLAQIGPCHPKADHAQDASQHLLWGADALVMGLALPDDAAMLLLTEWAGHQYPPKELERKIHEAKKTCKKERGYLLVDPAPSTQHIRNGHSHAPLPPSKRPPVTPQIITADALMRQHFDPLRWAVEHIIPEGCTILAGPPKVGKSWLVLGIALAVAAGGVALGRQRCLQGDVLYLALEDGPRRLQARLTKALTAQRGFDGTPPAPPGLHLTTSWPRPAEGGIGEIGHHLDQFPNTRLVIVDTLARMRDRRQQAGQGNVYQEDYDAIAGFQEIALKRSTAFVIIHHTRKGRGEDPMDDVSGSLGLGGAADCILVLRRKRQEKFGTLQVMGRDVEERELNILWDAHHCHWQITDEPPPQTLSGDRERVVTLLGDGQVWRAIDIRLKLGLAEDHAHQLLRRMAQDAQIQKAGYGCYRLPLSDSSDCQTRGNSRPRKDLE